MAELLAKAKSYNPRVCMDPNVRYTTQAGVWSMAACGFKRTPREQNRYGKTAAAAKPKQSKPSAAARLTTGLIEDLC